MASIPSITFPASAIRNTARAIKRYGASVCDRAYFIHKSVGEGAASIACGYALQGVTTTNAADAAINAGRVLKLIREKCIRTDREEELLDLASRNQNPA